MPDNTGADDRRSQSEAASAASAAGASGSTPNPPHDEFSREDYAIHARRSELPLFGKAVAGGRDDSSWISALSGSIGSATKAAADPTIAKAADAISRRPRRRG
ncbi:hypothetical protein HQQ80_08275 [Microbacteriaceae bacterium VKM Ac-2855]|nr:hypothetical protein [Microbacteriaceae bacterium VKM Ac-2855]